MQAATDTVAVLVLRQEPGPALRELFAGRVFGGAAATEERGVVDVHERGGGDEDAGGAEGDEGCGGDGLVDVEPQGGGGVEDVQAVEEVLGGGVGLRGHFEGWTGVGISCGKI